MVRWMAKPNKSLPERLIVVRGTIFAATLLLICIVTLKIIIKCRTSLQFWLLRFRSVGLRGKSK